MKRHAAAAAASLAVLGLFAGAAATSVARESKNPERGFRLVRFGSCDELLRTSKEHANRLMQPWGLPSFPRYAPRASSFSPGARRRAVDFSTTNVQEEGIDEPDLLKTNGSVAFFVRGYRLFSADVDGGPLRILGSLELGYQVHELLLGGSRLLVLSRNRYSGYSPSPGSPRRLPPYEGARTTVTEIDVSRPSQMRVVRTMTLDGQYVAGRLHGHMVRVVISSAMPDYLGFGSTVAQNRTIVDGSPLHYWLPNYELRGPNTLRRKYLVQCRHVWRPLTFSGLGLLTVVTMDLDRGLEPVNTVSIMSDAQIVYASSDSLYVAAEGWASRPADWGRRPARGARTTIHKLGIASPKRTRYRASGTVAGFLVDQWSLSEHEGVLRVVSTDTPHEVDDSETASVVTTFEERVGRLVQVGRLGNLGKGERLYAVRFMDDVGFVVTFREVDPLHVVDLSKPERPRLRGELRIPGFSTYLHPVGDDLLFGVGRDSARNGNRFQASLFDVSNLGRPRRLARLVLGGYSQTEYDHHAFLYWPRTRLVLLPMEGTTKDGWFAGAAALKVGRRTGVDFAGRLAQPKNGWIVRSLVVDDRLYTFSYNGIEQRHLGKLTRRAWVEFPRT